MYMPKGPYLTRSDGGQIPRCIVKGCALGFTIALGIGGTII